VAAVIVHHATPDLLRRCLEALAAHGAGWLGSTVVVDNASPGSALVPLAAAFPQVRFVRAERNLGFAAGANLGWRAQPAPFHLLLNPDAWLQAGALDAMLACMTAAPQAAVVAPRLENPDGTLQYSCRRFPTLAAVLLRGLRLDGLWPQPVDRYLMRDWDHGQRRPVDWAIGACLLLRQQAVQAVGGFDESFFLYYEDADLCRRLQQAGWQVWYEPGARVRHLHRRASARCGRAARPAPTRAASCGCSASTPSRSGEPRARRCLPGSGARAEAPGELAPDASSCRLPRASLRARLAPFVFPAGSAVWPGSLTGSGRWLARRAPAWPRRAGHTARRGGFAPWRASACLTADRSACRGAPAPRGSARRPAAACRRRCG